MEILEACPDLHSLHLGNVGDGGHEWCSSAHAQGFVSLVIRFPENFPVSAGPLATRNLRHLRVHPDEEEVNSHEAIFSPTRDSLVFLALEGLDIDSAPPLIECFAAKPFPLVRHLVLEDFSGYEFWPRLITSFPSLVTLEVLETSMDHTTEMSVTAVGASAIPTLQNLIFSSNGMAHQDLGQLLRVLKSPNFRGLRRLEIAMVSKDELAGEAGLALLDECEERSISLLCRYGYLTRDMMEDASPPRT